MMKRLVAFVLFLGVVFGAPRVGEAAIMEFIWGLSGPQLIGIGVGCKFDGGKLVFCPGDTKPRGDAWSRVLFTAAGSVLVSTGRNAESGVDYRFGDVGMIAVEPNVSFNSVNTESGVRVFHNIGPTYDILFGLRRDFDTFQKLGIKVTPLEVVFRDDRAVFAFNLRLYPDGFTDDEFGVGQRLDYDRPFETVIGVTFGYSFK